MIMGINQATEKIRLNSFFRNVSSIFQMFLEDMKNVDIRSEIIFMFQYLQSLFGREHFNTTASDKQDNSSRSKKKYIYSRSQIVFYRILCCKDEQTYKKVQILKTNVYLDIQLYIDGHNLIVIEFIIKKAFFFAKKNSFKVSFFNKGRY